MRRIIGSPLAIAVWVALIVGAVVGINKADGWVVGAMYALLGGSMILACLSTWFMTHKKER